MERFKSGLTADPTVEHTTKIAEVGDRTLLRVGYSERGAELSMTPLWSDLNISLLDATLTLDGWEMRMRMPDRAALTEYRETCARTGLDFYLDSVYEEQAARSKADAQLTAAQRETLRAAHALGYFEIPRGASLADVANHCGISSQAASERLRRGTATLTEAAIET